MAPVLNMTTLQGRQPLHTFENRGFIHLPAAMQPSVVDVHVLQREAEAVQVNYTEQKNPWDLMSWDVRLDDTRVSKRSETEFMIMREDRFEEPLMIAIALPNDTIVTVLTVPVIAMAAGRYEDTRAREMEMLYKFVAPTQWEDTKVRFMFAWRVASQDLPSLALRLESDKPPDRTVEPVQLLSRDARTGVYLSAPESKTTLKLYASLYNGTGVLGASISVLAGWFAEQEVHASPDPQVVPLDSIPPTSWLMLNVDKASGVYLLTFAPDNPLHNAGVMAASGVSLLFDSLAAKMDATARSLVVYAPPDPGTLWVSFRNEGTTEHVSGTLTMTPQLLAELQEGEGKTLEIPAGRAVYAAVEVQEWAVSLVFKEREGQDLAEMLHNVSIAWSLGSNKWPSPNSTVDVDHAATDPTQPIEMTKQGVYHLRFLNTGTSKLTVAYQLEVQRPGGNPDPDGSGDSEALGGADALLIIVSLIVVSIIFAAMAVAATRHLQDQGSLVVR